MKRILKITGIILAIVIILLALSPFFFKGTLEKLVKRSIDANINADVAWNSFDLSLFRSFPDAALTIKEFSVINREPFKGDTLATGKLLKLDMGITQLFKSGNDPIKIDAIFLDQAFVNILIDTTGRTNYNIAIQKDTVQTVDSSSDSGFKFDLKRYELKDSKINYLDQSTQTFLFLKEVNHLGKGDFSLDESELDTETSALASLKIEDTEYLTETIIALDAVFQLDLKNQKYSFLENEAKVNELPLTFNGYVKINETNNEVDMTFKTPSSDFKNFLAVIPKAYVKNIEGVTTTGNFIVDGKLKGIIDETHIPTMDIKVESDNASFKYPELPKTVRNISIDANLKNETGLVADTYLTIGRMTFKIDEEIFNLSGTIKNLTENALVQLALKGTLNLAHIEQVLPLDMEQKLSGIFKADVNTNFDMRSVENEQYQNIKSSGTASLTGFNYKDDAFAHEINIASASIAMTPQNIQLKELSATSGKTDIQASGDIQNLIPWIMAKQDLKGRFTVKSKTFNVNDFMTASEKSSTETAKSSEEKITNKGSKIPDFLDATIDFTADRVLYDNIVLDKTTGTVSIKNETATLTNVTSKVFGGDIGFSGNVNTKNAVPTFGMNLDLKKIDIDESFGQLALLKYLAPIAKALDGNLNTVIQLSGELNEDYTPNLATLAGNALAQIITAEVNTKDTPLLAKLDENLSFLKLDRLSLRDVSTALQFSDGNIIVKPFDFDIRGIKITAGGRHGLDQTIDYTLAMDIPAKYLGSDVNKLLAKLDPAEANAMTVSLPVGLTGSFSSPKVSLNTEAAVNSLTKKLIEKQKQELVNKGTDILQDIIVQGTKPKDSVNTTNKGGTTPQETTTKVLKDVLGDIFGKKKLKDTTKTGN
jgi:hypothetical protein